MTTIAQAPERAPRKRVDAVLDRPGLLLTRGLLYLMVALVLAALLWAALAPIDVVVTAEGRLVPRGEPIRLSIDRGGILSEVAVTVGATVAAGQTLLEVDPFREDADVVRLGHELEVARSEAMRRRETAEKLGEALGQAKEELARTQSVLEIAAKQAETFRVASEKGLLSKLDFQEKAREVEELKGKIARLRSELVRSAEEIAREERLAAESTATALAREAELARAAEARHRTVIVAPRAGTVTSLVSTSPGRYVGASDVAVTLMPADEPLFAEIEIPNPSMRRIYPGLAARLRFQAFPYQDYGTASGRLVDVEPDAKTSGSYRAWIALDAPTLHGPLGEETLRAGLLLSAEILVDRMTVLRAILDPYRRLRGGMTIAE